MNIRQENFNGVLLAIRETMDRKGWGMTIDEVAKGYGVIPSTIRMHLKNHMDEIRDGIERAAVNITDRSSSGVVQTRAVTLIYKEGIIKLGYFIRSKQAAAFRQWATNLIVAAMDNEGIGMKELFEKMESTMNEKFDRVENRMNSRFERVEMVCTGLRDEVDELKEMLDMLISDSDAKLTSSPA
jgi:hypothetical protein